MAQNRPPSWLQLLVCAVSFLVWTTTCAKTKNTVSACSHNYRSSFISSSTFALKRKTNRHGSNQFLQSSAVLHKKSATIGLRNVKNIDGKRKFRISTAVGMYNLPSGGGGGGGGRGGGGQILSSILTIVGIGLFFASPLGGVFFAVTNSLFLLAFLTPLILVAAFQLWQYFNTIEAPCPNCAVPVRAMKNKDEFAATQPTVCFNCGAIVRADPTNKKLELCNDPSSMFNSGGGVGGMFDDFFGQSSVDPFSSTSSSPDTQKKESSSTIDEGEKRIKRERTVIDVEIEED